MRLAGAAEVHVTGATESEVLADPERVCRRYDGVEPLELGLIEGAGRSEGEA